MHFYNCIGKHIAVLESANLHTSCQVLVQSHLYFDTQVGWVESKLKYFAIYLDTAESRVNARLLPIAFEQSPRAQSLPPAEAASQESNTKKKLPETHAAASVASTKADSQAPNAKAMQYYYIGLRSTSSTSATGETPDLHLDLTEAWYGFAQSVLDFPNKNSNMDILIRSITREHVPPHVHPNPATKS